MTNLGWPSGRQRLWRAGARWSVLALLVLGIGALAVFGGGSDEELGGARGLLTAQLAEMQQAEMPPEQQMAALPAAGGDVDAPPDKQQTDTPAPEAKEAPQPQVTAPQAEQEVHDDAPEPWVGDAALTAEAGLLNMLPPLAGTPSRAYGFGYDATFADYRFHQGVDWQAEPGTAVQAPLAGVVTLLDDPFYGSGVEMQHEGALISRYYGVKPTEGLENGQTVSPGEKLGEVTTCPVFEDGQPPHLHWEVWLDGEPADPADYQAEFGAEQ